MTIPLNDAQLDALRELANIASGTAATALSQMLGRDVELRVPRALALPLADVVETCGDPEEEVAGVVIAIEGDLPGEALALIPTELTERLCALLKVDTDSEVGESPLREIGNILGTSYLSGLAAMTGLHLMPCPPVLQVDMLGAIVSSLLAATTGTAELALVLESELDVAQEPCAISFMLLPAASGISGLLAPLGLAELPA